MTERSSLYTSMELLSHRRNVANEDMKKKAKEDPKALEAVRGEMRAVSQEIKEKEVRLRDIEEELSKINLHLPNVPHDSVPVGASAEDNAVAKTWGEKPNLLFTPKLVVNKITESCFTAAPFANCRRVPAFKLLAISARVLQYSAYISSLPSKGFTMM